MPKPKFKETMEVFAGLVSAKCSQRPTVAHGLETTLAAVFGVVQGLLTSEGGCVYDPAVNSAKMSASSRFVFPPLTTSEMLSSVSVDAPLAQVSSAVGFGSFGTSSPLPSSFGGACLTLQLRPEGSSQPIFALSQVSFLEAVELGEKLRSTLSVSSISKPF
jgi:hypothetical protein